MKKKQLNLITCIILLICFTLLSIFSCTTKDENIHNDVEYIKYGTSFGECYGYCENNITINSIEVILEKNGWTLGTSLPDITYKEALENIFLQELFEKVDFDKFLNLNGVIGCPDCSDGGAEWIEIKTEDKTHKVTFEYFSDEIPELETILEALRELGNSLQKEAYLVVDKDTYNNTIINGYSITKAFVDGDTLNVSITSSGCSGGSWIVNLIDSEAILESNPIERALKINLVNEEVCLAFVHNDYEINIAELQIDGENEVLLNIEGWSESILYKY